jgi:hypothetical protein
MNFEVEEGILARTAVISSAFQLLLFYHPRGDEYSNLVNNDDKARPG